MQDVNINLVLFHDNLKTKRAHDVVKPKLRTNISDNIVILQYSLNIMTNLQTMSLCFYGLQVYGTFPSYIDVLFPLSLRRLLPGLTISTWRVSDGKHELITLPEHMCSPTVVCSGVRVAGASIFCLRFCRTFVCPFILFW